MIERVDGAARFARLEELQAAWAVAHPKRAAGGTVSLAGFGYQFLVVLRDVTRAWLATPSLAPPVTEALSDLVQVATDGQWTITQMKKTGTSGALAKALEELWTIDVVARRETPDLVDSLSYEVRCASWQLVDAQASIDRWTPPPSPDSHSESAVENFRRKVVTSTDPNPRDDLIDVLANKLRAADPLGWIHEWVGKLMAAAVDARDSRALSSELFSALSALRNADSQRRLPDGIRLISPDLREPDAVTTGPYLVGEQPRLRHLREGWFAPRRWQVVPATEAIREWISTDPFGTDRMRRLPVFWIEGRSGSGKSILLLQVMARLVASGVAPLMWLGGRTRLLPDAMKWAQLAVERGAQPIVCIDDPFSPGDQEAAVANWRRALVSLENLRDDGEVAPIIIACGPSEQVQALERDLIEDVNVSAWRLDESLDEANLETLRSWFEERTGAPAPDAGEGDVLMVQRFFEWRTGEPLTAFASRFRKRVEKLDQSGRLSSFIVQLLSVNRLYTGLPSAARFDLRDDDRDALEVLRSDHHIDIDVAEGRPGVWLTHPHLADALFVGWFSKTEHHQRVGALRDAILLSKKHGENPSEETAPLWAIARALTASSDEVVAARIHRGDATPMLAEAHSLWTADGARMSFAHLPSWLALSLELPDLELVPKPFEDAIEQMSAARVDETGFRLTCHILLSRLETFSAVEKRRTLGAIRSALDGAPEWYEWPHVGKDLARRTGASEDGLRLVSWVSNYGTSRHAPSVIGAALKIEGAKEDALKATAALANLAPCNRAWSYLFEGILGDSDRSPPFVLAWCRRHQTAPSVAFVLRSLIRDGNQGAVTLAHQWLAKNASNPIAHFLIELVLSEEESQEVAISIAAEWLSLYPESNGWAFLLQKLLEVLSDEGRRRAFIRRGLGWLEGRESRSEWAHLLAKLLSVAEEEGQLRALMTRGAAWLEGRGDRPEWAHVWQALLDAPVAEEYRQWLVAKGIEWLEGRERRSEWPHVLEKLLDFVDSAGQQEELVARGIAWLAGREDRSGWPQHLLKLLCVASSASELRILVGLGVAWLDGREKLPEWAFVFQKVMDLVDVDELRLALWARGVAWLKGREDRPEWSHVFQKVLEGADYEDQRQRLLTVGLSWLNGREDRAEWAFVFQKLIDFTDESEQLSKLIDLGIAWLAGREERPEWAFVLRKLIDVANESELLSKLTGLGIDWLDGREHRQEWPHLLKKLIETVDSEDRPFLVERGIGWVGDLAKRRRWLKTFQRLPSQTVATASLASAIGQVLPARVTGVANYGVFFELQGSTALLHISKMQKSVRADFKRQFPIGQEKEVRILFVDPESQKVSLADPVFETPTVGQTLTARVTGVADYGVFFEVQGHAGLLHISKMSKSARADMEGRFPVGQEKEVRVLSVDPQRQKIRLADPDFETPTDLADEAAETVAATGKPVELPPMPAWERRLVHEAIDQHVGVKSGSLGRGADRRVVILPDGDSEAGV
ncbi:MAG: S1 RNA-binding domain-containing protein [Acidobacteriota bacterium]